MRTATTFDYQGTEIPVWFFDTYEQLEHFTDTMTEERTIVEVKPEYHPTISGIFYRDYPLDPGNATAAYKVTESDWPMEDVSE